MNKEIIAEEKITHIEIPFGIEAYEEGVVLFNIDQTDEIIGRIGIVVQENTLEEAKRQALAVLKYHIQYLEGRSRELDKWKPFQKGDWSHIGGKWFMLFGLHVYSRYGKEMKRGWYIPFTKLNISIHNRWKQEKIIK